jgi:hypothetical protein
MSQYVRSYDVDGASYDGGMGPYEYDTFEEDVGEEPYIGPSSDGEADERTYWSLQRVLQVQARTRHAVLVRACLRAWPDPMLHQHAWHAWSVGGSLGCPLASKDDTAPSTTTAATPDPRVLPSSAPPPQQ